MLDVSVQMPDLRGLRMPDAKPILKKIGTELRGTFQRNMTSGLDPDGKPLAPVEAWTRFAGATRGTKMAAGEMVPLLNTGRLRASIGTKNVTASELEFGFDGTFLDIADRMIHGKPGLMLVREKVAAVKRRGSKKAATKAGYYWSGVKTSREDGHQYGRIFTKAGWRTKQVVGGNQIMVKPKKRNFFYLTAKQSDDILALVTEWIADAMKSKAS